MGKEQIGQVLWLTGLSGSGKSTLADALGDWLEQEGIDYEKLDGDIVREMFPSTGFSKDERNAHIRRIGYVASLLAKHGVVVIASFISPYRETRDFVRSLCLNFVEIHVKTPLEVCEKRDVKGLYKRARAGEIKQFTGIDDPYEEPKAAEIVVETDNQTIEESAAKIIEFMKPRLQR